MNEKQKEVFQTHRKFLTRNLLFTDEFCSKLLSQGIITDSVLKDIKLCTTRDAKAGKLFDLLPLRGSSVYEKFCDILHLTGQQFLAEFLRDEETAPESIDLRDLYKKVPFLDKMLRDHEKKHLEEYISTKAKSFVLKTVWGTAAREKEHAMDAKQKQLEQSFEYEDKMKKKMQEMADLEKKLADAKNETIEVSSQIKFLKNKLKETEDKFKSDFGVQMQFSMANENTIQNVSDKLDRSGEILKQIEEGLKEFLFLPARDSERDQMALYEFPYAFLLGDFESFVGKHRLLLDIKKEYEKLLEERQYILSHLGFKPDNNDTPSLLTAYQDFAIKTDNDITELKKRIQTYSKTIEGQKEKLHEIDKETDGKRKVQAAGTVWQGAIMSVMRKQLQDVKYGSRTMETRIQHFENEIAKLKARNTELETKLKALQSRPQSESPTKSEPKETEKMVNGHSSTPVNIDEDSSSSINTISMAAVNRGKKPSLPPLGTRNPLNVIEPTNVKESPKRNRPRPLGSMVRANLDANRSSHNVDGLVTAPVKLENRIGGQVNFGKMGHGLGDLKAMHGKYMRPGQPTVKGGNM